MPLKHFAQSLMQKYKRINSQNFDGGNFLTGLCSGFRPVLSRARLYAQHRALIASQAVIMPQALLRQRDSELEERGRLLLKSKVQ